MDLLKRFLSLIYCGYYINKYMRNIFFNFCIEETKLKTKKIDQWLLIKEV